MKKFLTNNIGYKILALIFSAILWLVVVNIQDPNIPRTISGIPITILNENAITDQNLVYTKESGETAFVRVTGPRSIVEKLRATDFIATSDFTELSITNAAPVEIVLSPENSRYSNDIDIIDKTNSIVINIESIKTKNYTVEVAYKGATANGFVIGSESIDSPVVKVSAPESILKTIKTVVLNIDVSGKNADFTVHVQPTLLNDNGDVIALEYPVSIDINSITVAVDMHRVKEVPINFATTGTPQAGYELVALEYNPLYISVHGLEEDLENIESISVPSSLIDISASTSDVSVNIDISLYLPEGIYLYDENQRVMRVTAQIQGPIQRSINIGSNQVELRNVPGGYDAVITTSPIPVRISGNPGDVNDVDANSLTGFVDLSAGVEGSNERVLELSLPTGVSLVSPVRVTVTLTSNVNTETTTETITE